MQQIEMSKAIYCTKNQSLLRDDQLFLIKASSDFFY